MLEGEQKHTFLTILDLTTLLTSADLKWGSASPVVGGFGFILSAINAGVTSTAAAHVQGIAKNQKLALNLMNSSSGYHWLSRPHSRSLKVARSAWCEFET